MPKQKSANPGSGATGDGLATIAADGTVLDTWFADLRLDANVATSGTMPLAASEATDAIGRKLIGAARRDPRRNVNVIAVRTRIDDISKPPIDIHDIFLRLQLLSHRIIKPHEASTEGMVAMSPAVAWTSIGPCLPEQLDAALWTARIEGFDIDVRGIFKLPRMTDYVRPKGVMIADTNRVWLGAYLAPGTMVTAEGFCSFNAGTLGACMVEGRISAGVVVGEGVHIGGSASLMGTISGGGKQVVSIGNGCLLGANSGVGIALGDNCVVEAGCYITAGMPVALPSGQVVKAVNLSGRPSLLFRRNSQSGRLEAVPSTRNWGGLNPALHPVKDAVPA
jgi:2,3,4,5-tetrahydropyridine-2-carboxylate N-succinyltransferase